MRKQQGFTLIELMIVLAIVGILAAIALPIFGDYTVRAKVVDGLSLVGGAKAAVSETFLSSSEFPANNAAAGLSPATAINSEFVSKVEVINSSNGRIRIHYTGDTRLEGAVLGFDVTNPLTAVDDGSLTWRCFSISVPNKYLPRICR